MAEPHSIGIHPSNPTFTRLAIGRAAVTGTKVLALAMSLLISCTVAAAGVRNDRPNLVGGELGGRGLLLTLNYERFVTNHFGLGGGFMAIGTSDGTIAVMPLYVSVLTGDVHSLYLSMGTTFLGGGGSVQDFESTWLVQGSVGYHYQSTGGFFVRPFFTYMVPTESGSDGFLIWPGLTIGGSF
ncbi:MAG TPA: hypothetical protein VGK93_10725 [Candidatus Eisenbacteria bacterium]|jgi:hypothetical protein